MAPRAWISGSMQLCPVLISVISCHHQVLYTDINIWNPYHLVYSCTYPHVHGTWPHVKCYSTYYVHLRYISSCTKLEMYIHAYTWYIHVQVYTVHISVCTWYTRVCTCIYNHVRLYECIYMYIPCIYMYIHPMSRFEGSFKVYTLMYHVQTGTYIF